MDQFYADLQKNLNSEIKEEEKQKSSVDRFYAALQAKINAELDENRNANEQKQRKTRQSRQNRMVSKVKSYESNKLATIEESKKEEFEETKIEIQRQETDDLIESDEEKDDFKEQIVPKKRVQSKAAANKINGFRRSSTTTSSFVSNTSKVYIKMTSPKKKAAELKLKGAQLRDFIERKINECQHHSECGHSHKTDTALLKNSKI